MLSIIKLPAVFVACGVLAGIGGMAIYTSNTASVSLDARQAIIIQPKVAPPVRTVAWFEANTGDRKQKLAVCNDNPGAGSMDPECENALTASNHVAIERLLAGAPK